MPPASAGDARAVADGSSPGKTAIQAHVEKLPDGEAREAMRDRWREALGRVAAAVNAG